MMGFFISENKKTWSFGQVVNFCFAGMDFRGE